MTNPKKVLLIKPWKYHDENVRSHDLSKEWRNGPYNILCLASYLQKHDVPVSVVDLEPVLVHAHGDVQRCLDLLTDTMSSFRPDIIGISLFSYQFVEAQKIVSHCRNVAARARFSPVFLAGGIHSTIEPNQTVTDLQVDYAFVGEGEIALKRLAFGERPDDIPGFFGASGATPTKGEEISNLDELPFPNWQLCDYRFYSHPSSARLSTTPVSVLDIMLGRGCVHRCAFCAYSSCGRVRFHSANYIVEQIEMLLNTFRIDGMYFIDSSIGNKRRLLESLCTTIIDTGLNKRFFWYANMRANQVDEPLLKLMMDAGCRALFYGFESGSQRVLDRMNKKCSVDDNYRAAELHNRLRFPYNASMIVGYPDETEQDIQESFRFLKTIAPPFSGVNWYVPLPGSRDYSVLKEAGKIQVQSPLDWRFFGQSMSSDNVYAAMPPERLKQLYQEGCDIAYKLRTSAETWIRKGNLDTAERALTANLEGERLLSDGYFHEASMRFIEALSLDPFLPLAINNLGVVRWQQGEKDAAVHQFRTALQYAPHSLDFLFNCVQALIETNRIEEAKEMYDAYLESGGTASDEIALSLVSAQYGDSYTFSLSDGTTMRVPVKSLLSMYDENVDGETDFPSPHSLITPLSKWDIEKDDKPILRVLYRQTPPRHLLELGNRHGLADEAALPEYNIQVRNTEGAPITLSDYFFDSILVECDDNSNAVSTNAETVMARLANGGMVVWFDFCPPLYGRFPQPTKVIDEIAKLEKHLVDNRIDLFWIYPSRILVGRKRGDTPSEKNKKPIENLGNAQGGG